MNFKDLQIHLGQTPQECVELASDWISEKASLLLKNQSLVSLALSGGKTPLPLYQHLAQREDISWSHLKLFLVDERDVDIIDTESNARLCLTSGLEKVLKPEQFIKMRSHPFNSFSAQEYETLLYKHHAESGHDLAVLGLGSDGHTASLFPDTLAGYSYDSTKLTYCHQVPCQQNRFRLTLSFESLLRVKHLIFFVLGVDKAKIIKEIFEDKNLKYPATLLLNLRYKHKRVTDLFIDQNAASLLNLNL
jgi:6-phosphogluconolactonase